MTDSTRIIFDLLQVIITMEAAVSEFVLDHMTQSVFVEKLQGIGNSLKKIARRCDQLAQQPQQVQTSHDGSEPSYASLIHSLVNEINQQVAALRTLSTRDGWLHRGTNLARYAARLADQVVFLVPHIPIPDSGFNVRVAETTIEILKQVVQRLTVKASSVDSP